MLKDCGRAAKNQRQPRSYTVDPIVKDYHQKNRRGGGHETRTQNSTLDFHSTKMTGRIFNGKPSKRGSWPWQVSLQLLHPKLGFIGHWCGGVLIESTWIITAAHCIHNDLFNLPIGALWTAVLGEWQLESGQRGSARIPIERVIIHERFNNYVHDIALMKLSRAAPLSKIIRTICLPEAINSTNNDDDNTIDKEQCIASGWGRSGPSPSLSNALLEANVPILNLEDCQRAYGKGVPIGPGHLCAGHTDGSSGSCVGDSGGPLQCRRRSDGVWQLTGVTSFGSGCARPGFPDVYTRLRYYLDWIKTTIATSPDFDMYNS
ncbi:chymotrypsin-like elastase family member 2A isoform X2 [Venturia canescens]|uniref:chymotrypsin-like elastase family member 2A isoform X2 n=1 Tax=Venturia canescens TaxID=32260 RepID=UPI001C9D06EF|nr:chymotrypsin-like elastase family member 2A isoform X2 [Venturia canescens]